MLSPRSDHTKIIAIVVVVSRVASLLSDMIILAVTLQFVYRMRREPLMRTMQAPLPTFLVKAGAFITLNFPDDVCTNSHTFSERRCAIHVHPHFLSIKMFINEP